MEETFSRANGTTHVFLVTHGICIGTRCFDKKIRYVATRVAYYLGLELRTSSSYTMVTSIDFEG